MSFKGYTEGGPFNYMCVSLGKAQVTRHPAQRSVIFHASPCLPSWTHLLNNAYRLRLAGHSSGITATFHRQNVWLLAPQTHREGSLYTCVKCMCVCVYTCMRLSSVINILRLIFWPRTCVGALQGTTQLQALTPEASQESSWGNAAHLSTTGDNWRTARNFAVALMRNLSLGLKTA